MQTPSLTLVQKLKHYWQSLVNQGVTADLNSEQARITHILNFLAFATINYSISFVFINIYQQRWTLAIFNLILFLGSALILFNNKKNKYRSGRIFLSVLNFIVFSTTALFYKNGGEYLLILNILTTILLFNKKWLIILFTALNAIAFVTIKYVQNNIELETPVGPGRVYFNMGWTMAFIIIVLYYFKSENNKYQKEIESKNDLLQEQKLKLEMQTNELEQKTRQLEILNKTKEKLFSVVAHDMKAPIASLRSSLELYNQEILTKEEFSNISEKLTVQVDNLYNNLENLLQWSSGQLNGIKVNASSFQLKKLALETISLLLQNASHKKIKIETNIPEELMIYADADHIRLILRNLISNAIKFTNYNGSIEIMANATPPFVKISVNDTGIGMDEATINNLLKNPETQSLPGTNNEIGTGLGLALCKEFAEKNKGVLNLFSKKGEGTTVELLIPNEA